jgi:hypothetical protein
MTDKARPPVPPPTIILTAENRKQSGTVPADSSRPAQMVPRTSPSGSAPGNHTGGPVLIMTAARPSDTPKQLASPVDPGVQNAQRSAATTVQTVSRTSTSGRPTDVHSDVQQTSTSSSSLAMKSAQSAVGVIVAEQIQSGRQMDVQIVPEQTAIAVDRSARTTKQPRKSKPKKKTDLDERGRFRHTIRLAPKIEQKLRLVAEILGVDLNAAIAVCVSVHHHRLTKLGGGDV